MDAQDQAVIDVQATLLHDSTYIDSAFIDSAYVAVRAQAAQQEQRKINIILVLDRSGSMAGSLLENAKTAVQSFVQQVLRDQGLDVQQLHLLVFDSYTTEYDLLAANTQPEEVIGNIRAQGGTNFRDVLNKLGKLLTAETRTGKGCSEYFVVFFTDGEDTSGLGPQAVAHEMDTVMNSLRQQGKACEMHTLGFGGSHDATFLSALTRCGTVQGSFQYIASASNIAACLDKVYCLLSSVSFAVRLLLPNGTQTTVQLAPVEEEGSEFGNYSGACFIDADTMKKLGNNVECLVGDDQTPQKAPIRWSTASESDKVKLSLAYANQSIVDMTAQVAEISNSSRTTKREELVSIQSGRFAQLKALLEELVAEVMRTRSRQLRGLYRGGLLEMQTLLGRFQSEVLSAALTGTLTNHKLATLNALAYSNITSSRLKRGLDNRAAANVQLMEDAEKMAAEIVAAADFSALSIQTDPSSYGSCVLTCCNYIEALQDSDCLCLALDVERSEGAIMEPALLKIKAIHPTYITAGAFLDAVEFGLGDHADEEEVHGGFQRGADAKVLVGQGRESITGALPLFINSQNWKMANLRMKAVMGWMCTLNPLGYAYKQVTTVPFSVLARAYLDMRTEKSAFREQVYQQVKDVCRAVYKQSTSILQALVGDDSCKPGAGPYTQLAYLCGPLQRTSEFVCSHWVWIMQLACAIEAGDVILSTEQLEELQQCITEELLRRLQKKIVDDGDVAKQMLQVMGLSLVDKAEQVLQSITQSGEDGILELPTLQELREGSVAEMARAVQWDNVLCADQALLQGMDSMFNRDVAPILEFACSPSLGDTAGQPADMFSLSQLTLMQKVSLLVQNMVCTTNSRRRAWVTEGKYKNPFKESQAILHEMYLDTLSEHVSGRLSAWKANMQFFRAEKRAHAFSSATTLDEAAKAVWGFLYGTEISILLEYLTQPQVPLVLEKMEMLVTGKYKGHVLYGDKFQKLTSGYKWNPSMRNVLKFLHPNWSRVSQQQAQELFKDCHRPDRIEHYYLMFSRGIMLD